MSDTSTASPAEASTADEAAAGSSLPPTAETLAAATAELTELLGDALLESAPNSGSGLWLRIDAASWRDCSQKLSDAGFNYFGFLSAIDWSDAPEGRYEYTELDDAAAAASAAADTGDTDTGTADTATATEDASTALEEIRLAGGETRFQMLMNLNSPTRHLSLIIKADIGTETGTETSTEASPSIETIHDIFPGADWHEREAHEMFGINFAGHPGLHPIYLPTEFEGHPLRKDFPLLAREVKPWPGVVDIEEIPESLQAQLEAEVMAEFEASLAKQSAEQ